MKKEIEQRVNKFKEQYSEWEEKEININLGTHMLITNNQSVFTIAKMFVLVYTFLFCIAKLIHLERYI